VLVIDATYKTNRYNMPMVDIVGVTTLNKTFFVGFGFIRSEKEPFYRFILRDLHDIYRQLNLPDPRVVLTGKEKALMNAIEAEFPFTMCMLSGTSTRIFSRRPEPSSTEILFLYSEIPIHSSYLD